jgi:hypothetical protein
MREFATLFQAPSPAVLTTYRKDGTAVTSPVWFRFRGDTFEVVIAENDVKLHHLAVARRVGGLGQRSGRVRIRAAGGGGDGIA